MFGSKNKGQKKSATSNEANTNSKAGVEEKEEMTTT
jgi:hypothetical protein